LGEGHLSAQFGLNCRQHTFEIAEYIVVPKPKDTIALCNQASVADSIGGGFRVLPSIDFDHEAFLPADEIANISANRNLPRKLVVIDLPVANTILQRCFRIGLVGA
jgi:hypothetical protein